MLLKGKTAIITGTNRGIGASMTEEFAKEGADIIACARKETPEITRRNNELSQKYGVNITPLYFDMTDYDAMKQAIAEIKHGGGNNTHIDILVNNAGITHNALFTMTDSKSLKNVFEVNFFSIYLFTQYIAKIMLRQKSGSIINIASAAAYTGNPGKSVYGAAKAAIIAMTKSIATELGVYGIRANCIAPGMTDTDMISYMDDNMVQEVESRLALKRKAKSSEIASTAVFLASDKASFITGQTIRVDGGSR